MTQLHTNEENNSELNQINDLAATLNLNNEPGYFNPIEPNEFEDDESTINEEELSLLDELNDGEGDDELLKAAELDNTDDDGELLNEGTDLSGEDLDIPGSDFDDYDELIGEEDEENNSYSEEDQENK